MLIASRDSVPMFHNDDGICLSAGNGERIESYESQFQVQNGQLGFTSFSNLIFMSKVPDLNW